MASNIKGTIVTSDSSVERMAQPTEMDETTREYLEREKLQEQLDMERALSTRLMKVIIKERATIARIYGLLDDQRAAQNCPADENSGVNEDNQYRPWDLCTSCQANVKWTSRKQANNAPRKMILPNGLLVVCNNSM